MSVTLSVDTSESSQSIKVSNNFFTGSVTFQYIDVTLNDENYRVDFTLDVFRTKTEREWLASDIDLDYIRDVFIVKTIDYSDVEIRTPSYNSILAVAVYEAADLTDEIVNELEEERTELIMREIKKAQETLDHLVTLLPEEPGDDED